MPSGLSRVGGHSRTDSSQSEHILQFLHILRPKRVRERPVCVSRFPAFRGLWGKVPRWGWNIQGPGVHDRRVCEGPARDGPMEVVSRVHSLLSLLPFDLSAGSGTLQASTLEPQNRKWNLQILNHKCLRRTYSLRNCSAEPESPTSLKRSRTPT